MSADTNLPPVQVYQLKVTLRDIRPAIWRRLLVTGDTPLAQIHFILQTVMGWKDRSPYRFLIHGSTYCVYPGEDFDIRFSNDLHLVRLRDFRLRQGEQFLYEYDLDFWGHDIRVEQVLPYEPRKRYPRCIDGKGDCPPEDSGGPDAYMYLVEERSSLGYLLSYFDDTRMIAERLDVWLKGGPQPTREETEFIEAVERLGKHIESTPVEFKRGEVNKALRAMAKEWRCSTESRGAAGAEGGAEHAQEIAG